MNLAVFNKSIEYIVLITLFIAILGTGYMFIVTIIFRKNYFAGFYNNWQFPMLIAIFCDSAYYSFLNNL